MSSYQAFLVREGQPTLLQHGRTRAVWDAVCGGSVLMPGEHGESLSWDAYCIRVPELLAYEPFVEDVLPGDLEMAAKRDEDFVGLVVGLLPKRLGGCQSLFTWSVGLVPFEARCFTGFQPPSSRLQSSPSEHCLNGYDTLGAVGCPV
jgi:hypothetical protein